jgi:hypothetical protein
VHAASRKEAPCEHGKNVDVVVLGDVDSCGGDDGGDDDDVVVLHTVRRAASRGPPAQDDDVVVVGAATRSSPGALRRRRRAAAAAAAAVSVAAGAADGDEVVTTAVSGGAVPAVRVLAAADGAVVAGGGRRAAVRRRGLSRKSAFECPICLTECTPREHSYTLSCAHSFCAGCIGQYVAVKVKDGAVGRAQLVRPGPGRIRLARPPCAEVRRHCSPRPRLGATHTRLFCLCTGAGMPGGAGGAAAVQGAAIGARRGGGAGGRGRREEALGEVRRVPAQRLRGGGRYALVSRPGGCCLCMLITCTPPLSLSGLVIPDKTVCKAVD